MALTAPVPQRTAIPSPAFGGLDDDQLDALYGDLSDQRDAIAFGEPAAAAALYDHPLRLIYSEIDRRAVALLATSRERLGLMPWEGHDPAFGAYDPTGRQVRPVHYHADDPGMACVEPDAVTRAVAVDALIAEHDRMGHDGIGCGCLDALDAI